ncbi:GDSL-type esterase/lipase family protein [Methylobacterium sp. J-077]|uniref:GDSL-type esterase/lipase family protein n=1 Tax=Methylobacterium sp. J-077 TaxID=2836656 RepID=UPI001FB9411F|nr:GDSL-type esterase/lipase family protein [Methylobacterium sp. J-077]MCJ2121339.1 GDSL-type esterase/lipase family protein [Methylobacterium sp. J-077]
MPMTRTRRSLVLAVLAGLAALPIALDSARAASATIVALGASNTEGMKLTSAEAYPAQLEQILRAKGLDVSVINAGVSGDTSEGMLNRVGTSVPDGTRVVILQPGGNDGRGGRRQGGRIVDPAQSAANLDAIITQLQARGIRVAVFNGLAGAGREAAMRHHAVFLGQFFAGIPDTARQPDGQHLTAEGYAMVAQRIAPQISAMLGRGGR